MNAKKEPICRLCLTVAKNGFQKIDDTLRQLFDILLLKLDLHITRDCLICQDCVEMAKKCLYFKSICLNREEIILSFSAGRGMSKQMIKFIYAEKEQIVIANGEDLHICRFCMSLLEKNNFVPLDSLLNETMFEMITKYMPEMDLNIIQVPIVCTTCRENLEDYLRFMLNVRDTKTKIKAYWKEDRRDNMELISLKDVQPFLFENIVEDPVDYQIYERKQESNRPEDTEGIYPEAYIAILKQEKLNISDEELNLNENSYKDLSETILNEYNYSFPSKKYELDIGFKTLEHNTRKYTSFQRRAQVNIVEDSLIHQDNLELKWNECSDMQMNHDVVCIDNIKQGQYSKSNLVDTKLFKYTEIPSDPKHKISVNGNNVSVKHLYKCPSCAHEAKRKWDLKFHMLIHKDVSEIKMFKCTLCAYESKRKSNLKTHMLIHKDVSEIEMYKCSLCAYQAKRKRQVDKHLLIHKDVSEIKMFKCLTCAYESKQKAHLTRHTLIHKDVREIKMYKCSSCAFQTKRKDALNRHKLVHT